MTIDEMKRAGVDASRSFSNDASAYALRAVVGYGFMVHGFAKLSRGSAAFAGLLAALGVPLPHLMAWVTILVEVIGGFAVLVGAFVPIVSIPMSAVLLVAMVTVHLPYGFSSIKLLAVDGGGAKFGPPGYETALLYLACLAAIVLGGPGRLSIDGWTARLKARGVRAARASEVSLP